MTTPRTGRLDQQRREALHPPKHTDVIDLDPSFDQELFHVAIRQPITQIPTNREDDHLGRVPESLERRTRDSRNWANTRSTHPATVALEHGRRPMQQSHHISLCH